MTATTSSDKVTSSSRRAAIGSFIGSTVEWYDFYVFTIAAAFLMGPLFFPLSENPFIGVMAAFATHAVGFFVRPLGALVFGHMGDRVGRKKILVTTLLLMGVATFFIGLLPTYEQIGMAAPVLLVALRLLQGFAVGGEWGGAVLVAVEHAPARRRTFLGSFAQLGSSAGSLLATGSFALLSLIGQDFLINGGWRIPFLLSAVMVVIGLAIRMKVDESPVMTELQRTEGVSERPAVEAVRGSWRQILMGIGLLSVGVGGYYVVTSFVITYGTVDLGLSESMLLNAITVASLAEFLTVPVLALLGDRIGARRVIGWSMLLVAVASIPLFGLMATGSVVLIWGVMCVVRIGMAGSYGLVGSVLAESFPARTRYTGISLTYQLCAMIFGSMSALVATGLLALTGSPWSVVGYLVAMCVLGAVCNRGLSRYGHHMDAVERNAGA